MKLFDLKEQGVLDTPLFLFDCAFRNGVTYRWSSHHVTVNDAEYFSRVVRTNVFEMQAASDGGVDTIPKISFELANADGLMSEIHQTIGFKGATVTVSFVFYNLALDTAVSDPFPVFRGILDSPDTITESTLRCSAINRLSLQRIALPPIRVQKRCPWQFPATADQRQEAVSGGSAGSFSRFYTCGYSPDQPGGCGNMNQGTPFAACDYSRAQCEQRGMFSTDSSGRTTARFGGIEYVPPVIAVRAAGEQGTHLSTLQDNEARYNDYVPLIYGTGWYTPSIVFARNDGNLTHFEVLLGVGQLSAVRTVLVNDIEIPIGRGGINMTGTGWYSVLTYGSRTGMFNRDFADSKGNPLGDPYGSMAYMQLVVPNSINDGRSVPSIEVLIDGLQVETFDADGVSTGVSFRNNPVWVILDVLRRSGWSTGEIDFATFAQAAAYCDEQIPTTDLNGNTVSTNRFQCNLILQARRSAGDVIRCIRNASRLYLTYSTNGLLQMKVENALAIQQPDKAESSNARSTLNGGWPVYEFGDGSKGTTGIARAGDQSSTFRVISRGSADTPNRFSLEFQDAFNSYQQDSLTLVNAEDVQSCGFEVSATPNVLGVPNYDQAARIVALCLNKSIAGNTYVEFQTSVRALGIQPGDIITITHAREGFDRRPFRVVKVSPDQNFRRALIRAQLHDDAWYSDATASGLFNSGPQPSYHIGVPIALAGVTSDNQFLITESSSQAQDGAAILLANVAYSIPPQVPLTAPDPPLIRMAPEVSPMGGTLSSKSFFYYAFTSVDSAGVESALSPSVLAATSSGASTYSIALGSISLPSAAVTYNVYRGPAPSQLLQISSNNDTDMRYVDTGTPASQILPPDMNYDHANLYWRMETLSPTAVTISSANSIGNGALALEPNGFAGMTLRIIAGVGAGQERVVTSNTKAVLTISQTWTVQPDTTSQFVVSQSAYQFGASSNTNQAQFAIPNCSGTTIQICARSANVYDVESAYELAPVTRWKINGAGMNPSDAELPPAPVFGLSVLPECGGVEVGGLAFHNLENTRTISLGTMTLYYYDESSADAPPLLASDLAPADTTVALTHKPLSALPQFLAIDHEIVRLTGATDDEAGFVVQRGLHGTTPALHSATSAALPLNEMTVSFPFLPNFFGTEACGNWTQPIVLSNARICSAELFMTNSQGNGPTTANEYTTVLGGGLRTVTGGQVMLQIPGPLAVQNGAVPPLDPGAAYGVRDMYAYVGQSPAGKTGISLQVMMNGQNYGAPLTIGPGQTQSLSQPGVSLPVLRAGKQIGLNVLSIGDQAPGSDLTVVIRV